MAIAFALGILSSSGTMQLSSSFTSMQPAVQDTENNINIIVEKGTDLDVVVPIVWDDENDNDGFRPPYVDVEFIAEKDGMLTGDKVTARATALNDWKVETTLPSSDDFTLNYKINVVGLNYSILGYTAEYDDETYAITLIHKLAVSEIVGGINWDDYDNFDGLRPESVQAKIMRNGEVIETVTLNADNNWQYKFVDNTYGEGGQRVEYTAEFTFPEDLSDEYVIETDGLFATATIPYESKDIEFKLVWDDDNDRDGLRRNFQTDVTVELVGNDKTVAQALFTGYRDTETYTFDHVRINDAEGNPITYSFKSTFDNENAGYVSTVDMDTYTMTNTHTPNTVSVSGKIVWDDDSDADAKRPESVSVSLYANSATVPARTITVRAPEPAAEENEEATKSGENVDAQAVENEWCFEFTDLYQYNDGKEIVYSVRTSDDIPEYSYEATADNNIVMTHTAGKTSQSVNIIWDDNNNAYLDRPENIVVQLMNGTTPVGDPVTLSTNNNISSNTWKDLDYKDASNNVITYTVAITDETKPSAEYYEMNTTTTGTTTTITFTYIVTMKTISGTVVFDDDDNNDNVRPDSVLVELYRDDTQLQTITLNDDDLTFEFTDLPTRLHGEECNYSLKATVDGYTTTVAESDGTYQITLKHENITTDKTAKIAWVGGTNRPDVKLQLLADGEAVSTDSDAVVVAPAEEYVWNNLPVYKDGQKIDYTVKVTDIVKGYTTEVTDDANGNSFFVTNNVNALSFVVVDADQKDVRLSGATFKLFDGETELGKYVTSNGITTIYEVEAGKTYTLKEITPTDRYYAADDVTIKIADNGTVDPTGTSVSVDNGVVVIPNAVAFTDVTGNIIWNLPEDFPVTAKPTVALTLKRNDTIVETKTVSTNSYVFKDLDTRDADGNDYTYTVSATMNVVTSAKDWTSSTSGNDITITYQPEMKTVEGSIIWIDGSDLDGVRPTSLTITISGNGVTKSVVCSNTVGWFYSVEMPIRNYNGTTVTYTVSQSKISQYEVSKEGNDFYNTHTPTGNNTRPIEDGIYYIASKVNNNQVIDIKNGSTLNGANVQLYAKNNTNAQKYKVTYNASSKTYTIQNLASGKMLDVASGKYKAGANVHQWEANGSSAQKWSFKKNYDGSITLIAAGNDMYALDLKNGSTKNSTNVQLYYENGTNAQKWDFIPTVASTPNKTIPNGTYTIVSKLGKNKVVDIANGSKDNKANARLWDGNGTSAQKYVFTYDNNGYYTIKNQKSGKFLDAQNGSTKNGTNVWQYAGNNSDAQKWKITQYTDGSYKITNKKSGKVLDVKNGSSKNGANIQLWTANNSTAQKWLIQ